MKKITDKKIYHRNYYLSKRELTEDEVLQNFLFIIETHKNPKFLTTVGFNEVSNYPAIQTVRLLKTSWCELLNKHGFIDSLYEYILDEYRGYIKCGDSNVGNFIKQHKYITQDLLVYFTRSKLKRDVGLNIRGSSDVMFKNAFMDVFDKLGHIPTYAEYAELGSINPISFYRRYTNNWDEVVKVFINDEKLINDYLKRKKEIKVKNATLSSKVRVEKYSYTEDQLRDNFIKVFDRCFKDYGVYPSRRFFNINSKIQDITYRKRYKIAWSKICELYGYRIENKNVAERIVLESISKILNLPYEAQKTWDWLIGSGGRSMYCDGYFTDINTVIEFDGVQHRKPVKNLGGQEAYERRIVNDKLKNKLLEENNIKLIRIDSREPWHETDYLIKVLQENNIIA